MRKAAASVLCLALAVLSVLIAARLDQAGQGMAVPVMAQADSAGYNILDLDLPVTRETAGSALIAELNAYYLTQAPTAKSRYTGLWSGKNLILIRAENWHPGVMDRASALRRLRAEGTAFTQAYAPAWYQGDDGREFALLTGMVPTAVESETALAWAGQQGTDLPFALGRMLKGMGYRTAAALPETGREAAFAALGFGETIAAGPSDAERMARCLPAAGAGPFFLYCVWTGDDGEPALAWLMTALEDRGLAGSTAVCLFTGGQEEGRAGLYLWGGSIEPAAVDRPCSELDVTPTLLDLLGAPYDARFLAGRDILAPDRPGGTAAPVVSLTGSAWSDWVTDLGRYSAAEDRFAWVPDSFSTDREAERYARRIRRQVYDRYVFSRRTMENNYFRIALGTQETLRSSKIGV